MKKLITNYSFDAANKTVTLPALATISPPGLLLITNVTDGIIIYNFADPTLSATINGKVITLAYDTSAMDSADQLQIYYDDGSDVQNVNLVETLSLILYALQNPSHMDKTLNRVRETAIIESGTVTTVTTVGTVSNMTNFGTQPADALYRITSLNTWANTVRRTIS